MSERERDVTHKVRALFGPRTALSSFTEFPSGAISLLLRWPGHFAVIQGKDNDWGLSIDIPEGETYTGPDRTFTCLDDALRAAHAMKVGDAPAKASGDPQSSITDRVSEA
ncbi:hypothetical protein [Nocardia sp. NBC_00511]|uniref:hypothetical protein n=1 Tax=Nocardia sp. NBC_00511 TaxID=2903591 RepID=UPI0030DFC091